MTKEQAIERLKKMIQINNGVIKEARKNGDIFAMQLTADLDTDSIAIETALSMLEEKEKNKELIKQHAIEITDVGGNSIKIDLDGKIHNVYKLEEE